VERGIAPVLVSHPVYQWGYVGVETIVKKLQGEQVPARIPMEAVRVSRENLNQWAVQLRDWGFTDVPPRFLAGAPALKLHSSGPAGSELISLWFAPLKRDAIATSLYPLPRSGSNKFVAAPAKLECAG
jgi:hypothetical protein